MKPVPVFLISVFLLMACGGGGGGAGQAPEQAPTNPSGPGPTPSIPATQLDISVRGVAISITRPNRNEPVFMIKKGSTAWTREGFKYLPGAGGNNGNWTDTEVKLNASETELLRVITDAEPSDMDYMAFGYWSMHPRASLDLDNGFEPLYSGSMPYAGNVKNLSGQATYKGHAIGSYSILNTSIRGHFTALVSLTASFGSSGQVQGRMTELIDIEDLFENNREPLSDFDNPLQFSADYDSSGHSFTGTGSTDCGTTGCTWKGRFLGPSGSGQVPTGVVGEFRKLNTNDGANPSRTVRLDGSFGAQRR